MHHSMMSYEDLKTWFNFNISYEDLKTWFNFKYLNLCIWKVHLQFENANILIA